MSSLTCDPFTAGMIDSDSPAMRRVWALAARVAPRGTTVLITGETGVGKERLARWLHAASSRSRGPFVAVNCAALADGLLESELFGHVRGAFTGAVQDRKGLFEAAHGGTLFLDEIGDVSAPLQAKLLRVLEDREVRRVGETATRRVDVRLIAATNRSLKEEVVQRRFRRDLYYRLRVVELMLPPLRARPEDVLPLARAFLDQKAAQVGRTLVGFTPEAVASLLAYAWPGNVRELENLVERACAVAEGPEIAVDDLPDDLCGRPPDGNSREGSPLAHVQRTYARAVLEHHQGDRRRTADELQISLATLRRWLRDPHDPLRAHAPAASA